MVNSSISRPSSGACLLLPQGAHPSTAQRATGALGDGGGDAAAEVPRLGVGGVHFYVINHRKTIGKP